MHLLTVTEVT